MKNLLTLTLLILLLTSNAFSSENDRKSISKDAKKLVQVEEVTEVSNSISSKIQNQIEEFARKKGITFGQVKNGRIFVYSVQEVDRPPEDPRFAQARIIAFERAWLDAQKKIALFIGTQITTKTIHKLFENKSEGAGNFKISNWDVIKQKIYALSDAAINKALEKLGVEPSKYGNLSYEKRKQLLLDMLIKDILKRTSAELAGTFIVQTFEGEENGAHAVGLIVMYSPRLKYIAQAIAKGNCPGLKGKLGHPISYYLPKLPSSLISTWGVRVVFTEDNLPAILSFGQWGISNSGRNPIVLERNRRYAREKAQMLADSYISEFLSSFLISSERQKIGEKSSVEAVWKDGDTYQDTIDRMVEMRWQTVKRKSSVRLLGVHTVETKLLRLPSKQEVAVVVRVWTCKSSEGAQSLKKSHFQSRSSSHSRVNHSYRSYVNQGKDMVEINDF